MPWINYFSGGSAVHGFPRASYGFPQSVGCLELPIPTAAKVFKLIDYGTLVNVAGPFVPAPPVATPGTAGQPEPVDVANPQAERQVLTQAVVDAQALHHAQPHPHQVPGPPLVRADQAGTSSPAVTARSTTLPGGASGHAHSSSYAQDGL